MTLMSMTEFPQLERVDERRFRLRASSGPETIRFADRLAGGAGNDSILCENRVEFIGNAFANGVSFMWACDGALLPVAGQSVTVVVSRPE